jgi:hypothetical protein
MFSRISIQSGLALLALCVPTLAISQGSGIADDPQVRGRAAYSPAMTLALLKKIEGFCASADKSARTQLVAALSAWQKRHAELLRESAFVRDELAAEVDAPGAPAQLKAEFDNMLNVRVPQQVDNDYRRAFPPEASRGWASKAYVCGAHAGTITGGQYDLERFDPELAAYLRKRINNEAAAKTGSVGMLPEK